jgi:hypothetical protein
MGPYAIICFGQRTAIIRYVYVMLVHCIVFLLYEALIKMNNY